MPVRTPFLVDTTTSDMPREKCSLFKICRIFAFSPQRDPALCWAFYLAFATWRPKAGTLQYGPPHTHEYESTIFYRRLGPQFQLHAPPANLRMGTHANNTRFEIAGCAFPVMPPVTFGGVPSPKLPLVFVMREDWPY